MVMLILCLTLGTWSCLYCVSRLPLCGVRTWDTVISYTVSHGRDMVISYTVTHAWDRVISYTVTHAWDMVISYTVSHAWDIVIS